MSEYDENETCSCRQVLVSGDKPVARLCQGRDSDVQEPITHGRRRFDITSPQGLSFKRITHGRRQPV